MHLILYFYDILEECLPLYYCQHYLRKHIKIKKKVKQM